MKQIFTRLLKPKLFLSMRKIFTNSKKKANSQTQVNILREETEITEAALGRDGAPAPSARLSRATLRMN
jgi:hypothetical protein